MPFFVIKKGLVLLEWKYFPTPKILDPKFLPMAPGRIQPRRHGPISMVILIRTMVAPTLHQKLSLTTMVVNQAVTMPQTKQLPGQ
ncbi:hypothetical protein, partial [Oenococcus oeni]